MSDLRAGMGPLEVVLVHRRDPGGLPAALGHLIGTLTFDGLVGGFALMLLVPLTHEVLALPVGHPGYWRCAALVVLTRVAFAAAFKRVLQSEAKR